MTAIASGTLAILLHAFFISGTENTPPLIYITAGFLTANVFLASADILADQAVEKTTSEKKKERDG